MEYYHPSANAIFKKKKLDPLTLLEVQMLLCHKLCFEKTNLVPLKNKKDTEEI